MIQDLYEIFEKKTALIANKVPFEWLTSAKVGNRKPQLMGIIPCLCDIPRIRAEGLIAPENPNHEFTKKLQEIVRSIEHVCSSPTCTSTFSKHQDLIECAR